MGSAAVKPLAGQKRSINGTDSSLATDKVKENVNIQNENIVTADSRAVSIPLRSRGCFNFRNRLRRKQEPRRRISISSDRLENDNSMSIISSCKDTPQIHTTANKNSKIAGDSNNKNLPKIPLLKLAVRRKVIHLPQMQTSRTTGNPPRSNLTPLAGPSKLSPLPPIFPKPVQNFENSSSADDNVCLFSKDHQSPFSKTNNVISEDAGNSNRTLKATFLTKEESQRTVLDPKSCIRSRSLSSDGIKTESKHDPDGDLVALEKDAFQDARTRSPKYDEVPEVKVYNPKRLDHVEDPATRESNQSTRESVQSMGDGLVVLKTAYGETVNASESVESVQEILQANNCNLAKPCREDSHLLSENRPDVEILPGGKGVTVKESMSYPTVGWVKVDEFMIDDDSLSTCRVDDYTGEGQDNENTLVIKECKTEATNSDSDTQDTSLLVIEQQLEKQNHSDNVDDKENCLQMIEEEEERNDVGESDNHDVDSMLDENSAKCTCQEDVLTIAPEKSMERHCDVQKQNMDSEEPQAVSALVPKEEIAEKTDPSFIEGNLSSIKNGNHEDKPYIHEENQCSTPHNVTDAALTELASKYQCPNPPKEQKSAQHSPSCRTTKTITSSTSPTNVQPSCRDTADAKGTLDVTESNNDHTISSQSGSSNQDPASPIQPQNHLEPNQSVSERQADDIRRLAARLTPLNALDRCSSEGTSSFHMGGALGAIRLPPVTRVGMLPPVMCAGDVGDKSPGQLGAPANQGSGDGDCKNIADGENCIMNVVSAKEGHDVEENFPTNRHHADKENTPSESASNTQTKEGPPVRNASEEGKGTISKSENRIASAGSARSSRPVSASTPNKEDIKRQTFEDGLKPVASEGGVSFFIPASEGGLKPSGGVVQSIAERITKVKRCPLKIEERMFLANVNRQEQMSRRTQFAQRDLQHVREASGSNRSSCTNLTRKGLKQEEGDLESECEDIISKLDTDWEM